ncbi:MAG: hypothetical protein WCG23_05605 [bacterium]
MMTKISLSQPMPNKALSFGKSYHYNDWFSEAIQINSVTITPQEEEKHLEDMLEKMKSKKLAPIDQFDPRLYSSNPMVPKIMKLIDPRNEDTWTKYLEHFFEEGESGKKGRIVKIRMPQRSTEIFPAPLRIVSIPLDKESYGKGIYTQYDNTMTEKSKNLFKDILRNTAKFERWLGRMPYEEVLVFS